MGARRVAVLCFLCLSAMAANLRLYLKDGTYHIVREYRVESDRVRFYSVERSDWEEIPLELVDLKRTESEVKERQTTLQEEVKAQAAEDQAEKEQREEQARVPQDPGVYFIDGKDLKPLKQAEAKAVTDKTRSILKRISPLPIVASKTTVEIDGDHSAMVVGNAQPEFYFRLSLPERFCIFKLSAKKGARVVQTWQVVPVSDEVMEDQDLVPILHRQVDSNLYKIWPTDPLKPGDYAVVEYTTGQRNIQIWDFAYQPAGQTPAK